MSSAREKKNSYLTGFEHFQGEAAEDTENCSVPFNRVYELEMGVANKKYAKVLTTLKEIRGELELANNRWAEMLLAMDVMRDDTRRPVRETPTFKRQMRRRLDELQRAVLSPE